MGRDGGGDERHHGLVRRLRVRRLHRLGWIKSQEHPRHRQSLSERVAKSTSIHRAKTSSVKAVKIKNQVKSIRSRNEVVRKLSSEPNPRHGRWGS